MRLFPAIIRERLMVVRKEWFNIVAVSQATYGVKGMDDVDRVALLDDDQPRQLIVVYSVIQLPVVKYRIL